MDNQDKNLKDILETVGFIKDNAATKEDLINLGERVGNIEQNMATKDDLERFATKDDLERFATKDDLERFATKDDLNFLKEDILNEVDNKLVVIKDEIITKIDAFVVLNQKLDTELAALRSKYERLEGTVQKMLAYFKLDL